MGNASPPPPLVSDSTNIHWHNVLMVHYSGGRRSDLDFFFFFFYKNNLHGVIYYSWHPLSWWFYHVFVASEFYSYSTRTWHLSYRAGICCAPLFTETHCSPTSRHKLQGSFPVWIILPGLFNKNLPTVLKTSTPMILTDHSTYKNNNRSISSNFRFTVLHLKKQDIEKCHGPVAVTLK